MPRGSVCLMILTSPQLFTFTGTGATKSLTSDVNEADDRLFKKTLPNHLQALGGNTPALVRLMAASPKVSPGRERGAFGAIGSVTVPVLIAPSELADVKLTCLPQQGSVLLEKQSPAVPLALVTHTSRPRVGVVPPVVKSEVTSRSPGMRLSVMEQ